MPSYTFSVTCTCDEIGDTPCQLHARENLLQDKVIQLENEANFLRQSIKDERLACIQFLRKRAEEKKEYMSRTPTDTLSGKQVMYIYKRELAVLENVAEEIKNGKHHM